MPHLPRWFRTMGWLLVTGCGPTARIVTITREVRQVGVVPPASGPLATGPLVAPGVVSVELGADLSPVVATEDGPLDEIESLGNLTPSLAGELRLAGRASEVVELGLGLEFIPARPSVAASETQWEQEPDVDLLVRGGPQMRIAAPVGERVTIDFQGDLRFGRVRVARHIEVTRVEQRETDFGWAFDEHTEYDDEVWTPVLVQPRIGMGMGVRATDALHLSGGLFAQHVVGVDALDIDTWTCTYERYEPDDACLGPKMPPVLTQGVVGTAWLGLGLQVWDGAWLLPHAWIHTFPDDEGVARLAPIGTSVALRIPLGHPRAEPAPVPSESTAPPGWRQVAPPTSASARPVLAQPPRGWKMVAPPVAPPPPPQPPPPETPPPAAEEEHAPPPPG